MKKWLLVLCSLFLLFYMSGIASAVTIDYLYATDSNGDPTSPYNWATIETFDNSSLLWDWAPIEDYTSGKVCEEIRQAFSVFDSAKGPLDTTEIGKTMLEIVRKSELVKLTTDEAVRRIQGSKQCAIGERVEIIAQGDPTDSIRLPG